MKASLKDVEAAALALARYAATVKEADADYGAAVRRAGEEWRDEEYGLVAVNAEKLHTYCENTAKVAAAAAAAYEEKAEALRVYGALKLER